MKELSTENENLKLLNQMLQRQVEQLLSNKVTSVSNINSPDESVEIRVGVVKDSFR
jgi:hypothetical protein